MKRGLNWYQRDPIRALGGMQGLTIREIGVYNLVIDTIYVHGGECQDDPKHFAGFIADMGTAAVRNTIQSLVDKGKLLRPREGFLSNKRAREAFKLDEQTQSGSKTQEKRGENAEKLDKNRNVSSEFSAPNHSKNNDLDPYIREEESREEISESPVPRIDTAQKSERSGHGASPPRPAGTSRKRPRGEYSPGYEAFHAAYPRKVAKQAGQDAWDKLSRDDQRAAYAGIEAYTEHIRRTGSEIAHPATWLNGRRWEDEHPPPQLAAPRVDPKLQETRDIAARLRAEMEARHDPERSHAPDRNAARNRPAAKRLGPREDHEESGRVVELHVARARS